MSEARNFECGVLILGSTSARVIDYIHVSSLNFGNISETVQGINAVALEV